MVSLRSVCKNFAAVSAVLDINLRIRKGEFVSLLGPSGCGKTTTLSLIAGFYLPSSGEIHIENRNVTAVPSHRRDVGVVFQSYALFPHLSVLENVAFPLRIRRLTQAEISQKVNDALEMVRLPDLANRMPRQLSGGQQQRVALARALVYHPSVLLMDEPLAALDPNLREAMQLEIKRLHRRFEITTVYVTHDQHEALMLSDRVAVMRSGSIEQCGTPRGLYERPETDFVARFVGDANVFRGTILGSSASTLEMTTGFGTRAIVQRRFPGEIGTDIRVALRPERLKLHRTAPAAGCTARGTVKEVNYHGETTRVHVELSNGEMLTVSYQNDSGAFEIPSDNVVFVSWAEADMVVLRDDRNRSEADNRV